MTDYELELNALMEDQLRDLANGSRQWPEHEVVASLDKVVGREDGLVSTFGDYIDQDGRATNHY